MTRKRRAVLRGTGVVALSGLAGCIFGGGGGSASQGPPRTYKMVVSNRLPEEELEHAGTATMTARAERQVEGDNEVLFERTVDLDPGEKQTFEDAFETADDGSAYVIRAELAAGSFYSDPGPQTRRRFLRDGNRFVPGEDSAPDKPKFEVAVVDGEEDPEFVAPDVKISPPARL